MHKCGRLTGDKWYIMRQWICVFFLAKLSEMAMDIYIYIYSTYLYYIYNYIYMYMCVCEIVFVGYDIDGMYNQTYDKWVCLS